MEVREGQGRRALKVRLLKSSPSERGGVACSPLHPLRAEIGSHPGLLHTNLASREFMLALVLRTMGSCKSENPKVMSTQKHSRHLMVNKG